MQAWRTGPARPVAGGFSLIELLVVVAIVALLASIAMPMAEIARRRSQEQELRVALREIRSALDAYKKQVDAGHIANPNAGSGYPPSLEALVRGVPDLQSPQGAKLYFLRRIPRDPFAPDSIVKPAETWGLRSYASGPDDPRPGADVYDVHSLATGVGLDGRPYASW